MPVTTSDGQYFEDPADYAFHLFGQGTYDPKTDTYNIGEKPEPKEIYFVRHGDTDLNKEGEKSDDRAPVRGWNNTPLNEQGRADAEKAAERLSKEPITHIVTSDLPRASETASIIGDKLGITPEQNPGLRTWDLGVYTGQTGKDIHDAVDRLCLHAPDERPPAKLAQNMDNPDWYKDEKLDWNTVPLRKIYPFKEVPQELKDYTNPNYNPDKMYDFLQKQIEKNKLKPGEGFTIEENDGPKTYQYMGPHLPPGQNFFLKPPMSSQEVASSGESFNEFKDRVLTTFGQIAQDHKEHEVLVVSHNSPERILNAFDKAGQPASKHIDRKSYHSDIGAIDPGEHKILSIKNPEELARPTFDERFQGTKDFQVGPGLEGYDPEKMPDWWTRTIAPKTKWPGEGPQFNMAPEPKTFEKPGSWIMPYDPESSSDKPEKYLIGMKDEPPKMVPDNLIPHLKDLKVTNRGSFAGRPGRPPKGEEVMPDYRVIRDAVRDGATNTDLAKRYNVSTPTINMWMKKLLGMANPNKGKPGVKPYKDFSGNLEKALDDTEDKLTGKADLEHLRWWYQNKDLE